MAQCLIQGFGISDRWLAGTLLEYAQPKHIRFIVVCFQPAPKFCGRFEGQHIQGVALRLVVAIRSITRSKLSLKKLFETIPQPTPILFRRHPLFRVASGRHPPGSLLGFIPVHTPAPLFAPRKLVPADRCLLENAYRDTSLRPPGKLKRKCFLSSHSSCRTFFHFAAAAAGAGLRLRQYASSR